MAGNGREEIWAGANGIRVPGRWVRLRVVGDRGELVVGEPQGEPFPGGTSTAARTTLPSGRCTMA